MATIKNFPNNADEFVGAEPVMRWLHGRTSGVFGAANNLAVSAVAGSMAVTVSDGVGWMANAEANGSVFWIDANEQNGSPLQLSVDIADAVLPRIDRVVVSWQTVDYVAKPTLAVLKGTASSTPVAPTLTNTSLLRQISLAQISVPAGTSAITANLITDERLDATVCGIVTESVSVDTSMMQAQFNDWFNAMKGQLSTDAAGHLQIEIDDETTRAKAAEGANAAGIVAESNRAQAAEKELNQNLAELHTALNYSTSEQDTGIKWVDNRKVYQKTFIFTQYGTDSMVETDADIDFVIEIIGTRHGNIGGGFILDALLSDHAYSGVGYAQSTIYNASDHAIHTYCDYTGFENRVTIRYVKSV